MRLELRAEDRQATVDLLVGEVGAAVPILVDAGDAEFSIGTGDPEQAAVLTQELGRAGMPAGIGGRPRTASHAQAAAGRSTDEPGPARRTVEGHLGAGAALGGEAIHRLALSVQRSLALSLRRNGHSHAKRNQRYVQCNSTHEPSRDGASTVSTLLTNGKSRLPRQMDQAARRRRKRSPRRPTPISAMVLGSGTTPTVRLSRPVYNEVPAVPLMTSELIATSVVKPR